MFTDGRLRHSRDRFSTMAMHVGAIRELVWMQWYAASISVFPIRVRLFCHLSCMAAIMWSILSRKNP